MPEVTTLSQVVLYALPSPFPLVLSSCHPPYCSWISNKSLLIEAMSNDKQWSHCSNNSNDSDQYILKCLL